MELRRHLHVHTSEDRRAGAGGICRRSRGEIAAGAISIGLGGYLAARSDAEHYASERTREIAEPGAKPAAAAAEVTSILRAFGLTAEESAPIVAALRK